MTIANLETITDTQWWCRTWPLNGSSHIRVKQKLHRKHREACKSSWSQIGNLKSFILTINSLEFGKACEDLSWNHCTSTPQRSETNGIAERAAVRRVKEGTSAVLMQSGVDENWWADSIECFSCLRNVTDLLSDGKTPYKRRFGQPFKGPIIRFVHWLSITLLLRRPVKNPSIWKESLTWIVHRIRIVRGGEFGRVTYWWQTWRSWRRWTHRKSTQKDSMRKR